jgi:hypothetical protein
MATSTTNYSFSLPEVGGDTDQWGTQLNANWTLADSTIKTIADSVVDVTLTGNDYLTISGQAITVGDVDLTTDVTGTLPVGSGGTGLAALGSANQVLAVNSGGTALEYKTLSTGGTVTSVAVTGSDGIEIDSGSPITSSGTIALGINSTTLSTHLGLGSLATQSTITESQISDLGSYISASSTDTLTNKSGNISQWSNDAGYLTAESNDLTNVSGTLAIANGGTGQTTAVTARVALLPTLATNGSKLVAVNSGATDIEYIATSTLSITESQISDLGSYQTSDAGLTSIAGLTTAADKMIYTTAADTYAVSTFTAAGRALLDDADAAAQRTTLGLGSLATQASDSVSITGGSITGITDITVADGGTGASTEAGARSNLLPSYSGNGSKVLALNSGGTDVEWVTQSQVFTAGVANAFEHPNSVTDSFTVSASDHRFYLAPITFSGAIAVEGKMLVFDGPLNTTGTINVTGELNSTSIDNAVEHPNLVTTSFTVPSNANRYYVGPVSFSGTQTIQGKMLIFDGLYNQLGTANVSGLLKIRE